MADELKPCPFCGGPVALEKAHKRHDSVLGMRQYWGVVCRNTMNLGGTCCMEQVPSASPEAAADRWNRRAAPSPVGDDGLPEPFDRVEMADGSMANVYAANQLRNAYERGRAYAEENCRRSEKVRDLIAEVERLSAALEARIEEGKDDT